MDYIDAERVRSLLSTRECIDTMATAMIAVSERSASTPARTIMPLVDNSAYFAVMPGSLADPRIYGAKLASLHPANPAAGRPAIQGFVALFDHETGRPLALVDGAEITAMRTAAASGLATRLLARQDAASLGLFGSGVQAASHLEAICAVRDIKEVRVWSRSLARSREFARVQAGKVQVAIVAVDDPQVAAECDIVCTVTGAGDPLLRGEWLRRGAHVNLVGAHSAKTREAESSVIVNSRLYVDSIASALVEAGDILIPLSEGAIDESHVLGEIGCLLLGKILGRTGDDEITIYKSLGVVEQDLLAAHAVWEKQRLSKR